MKEPLVAVYKCEACSCEFTSFVLEVLRICNVCRNEYSAFQRWMVKHGTFIGWKSVEEWEKRYEC